ncbi:EAL domain-containing protein [Pseudoflavonifractor phocaeensis]|uniref:EAL domain-containing protein n=1 Tax=Pseudoflavonifractor phocaeensis TaxID=1870988 RepID=UPI00313BEE23
MNEGLAAFIHELVEDYFVRRDYQKLLGLLTDDFSFIGTGIKEVGHSGNIAEYFIRELEIYSGSFQVSEENCRVTMLTPGVALGLVTLCIESDPSSGLVVRMPMRFTVVLRRASGTWKVAHVHNSVPYQEQGEETYFNHDVARQNYHLLESVARKMAEKEVMQARLHDSLTGILNMEGFVKQAGEIIDQNPGLTFALMKFDINNFGYLNESYGYGVGDEILKDIAEHLDAACQENEVCGRVEKDNYAMLMVFHSKMETDRRMDELREELLGRELRERVQGISFTAGIYLVPPKSVESVKRMLDKALLAKQNLVRAPGGQSQYEYYTEEMEERHRYHTKLAELASAALLNGEFRLYIQPQVDLKTQCPVSGEALVRWVRPDGGIIMPDDFIPIFEKNDFIIQFDFYMLDVLCRQMRTWMDLGIALTPISINQSRRHLRSPDYIDRFCAVVDQYDIPHRYIAFELTESAFIQCGDVMLTLARELHRRGFLLAIDDFGTGYASLNLLGQLAADILKIDRSLLAGFEYSPRSKTILRKVVEMAQDTEMVSICEGVETREQADYLLELGCDEAQGYFYYRPMPAEQFETTILRRRQAGELLKN